MNREIDPRVAARPSASSSLPGATGERRRLRVLVFSTIFPNPQQPLHGLFVRERIQALASFCDVRVIAPVPWAPPVRWVGERYYGYSQVPGCEQQGALTVHHPRFFVVPKMLKAWDGVLMAVSCFRQFLRLRRTFAFDLVDAHWAYPDGMAAALLAIGVGVPVAITVRGDDVNEFTRAFWRRQCIRWALSRATLTIAVSTELKRQVERLVGRSDRVVVIGNGVDTGRFRPVDRTEARRRLELPDEERVLLSVGRLHTSKGYPIIVEAMARLRPAAPPLRLIVVGGPDAESDATAAIQAAAARCQLADRVHLVGWQSPERLVDWYNAADLFCLPTSREGSANVLYEALACGLPCITTPVGGNPEIIVSPELGMLVEPDAEALADAIGKGLARTWDRRRIAALGAGRTWDVVAAECYAALAGMVVPPDDPA